MQASAEQWSKFLSLCLLRRTPSSDFGSLAKELIQQPPLAGPKLAEVLFAPRARVVDPLIPVYAEQLLSQNLVDLGDILRSLLRTSPFHHRQPKTNANGHAPENGEQETSTHVQDGNPADLAEVMIYRVIKNLTSGDRPRNAKECFGIIKAVSRWMEAVVTTGTREEMMRGMAPEGADGTTEVEQETVSVAIREVVGVLAISTAENPKISNALNGKGCPKDLRQVFARSLSLYIPFISPTSMQISNRLEAFQKQYNVYGSKSEKGISTEAAGTAVESIALNAMDGTLDGPPVNSRAGLYVWLNASFVGCPAVDDAPLLNYLNARYKGDTSSTVIDLITASFDVLANAMYRSEPLDMITILRSFLVNKVPLLLVSLTGSLFPPLTPEFCISQALTHIDQNAFPSLSQMFDLNSGSGQLSEVRSEFLFACALHGLIPEESIERLLGEIPMQTLPAAGRYNKEDLISQISINTDRVEELLGEMEGMDGNAGAIALAIGSVIQNFTITKETMPLKTVCSALFRRPTSIDILFLFNTPLSILQSICHLLDSWNYDDDQGECQPVYDEFGCILLFLLVAVHRHHLSLPEIGITNRDSFVAKLLERGSVTTPLAKLSEEQDKHLAGWIRSLFEAEGISDELMSSCRPQDFYLLVPTFFSQSAAAYSAGVIDLDILKGGLEFFFETFLLTSLIPALNYLKTSIWESQSQSQANILSSTLQVVQILTTPPSTSGDAQSMHAAILSITAKSLESTLRSLRHTSQHAGQDPTIETILQTLSSYTHQPRRQPYPSISELESWAGQPATATTPGGLLGCLRSTFQSLVQWSAAAGASAAGDLGMQMSMPVSTPSYTHRQLLAAQTLLGAPLVIRTLIDELKVHLDGNSANAAMSGISVPGANAEIALDIASAMICAPVAAAAGSKFRQANGRMSLREALKLERDELSANSKAAAADPLRTDVIGRLYRRVEALVQSIEANQAAAAMAEAVAAAGADIRVPDMGASANVDMNVDVADLGAGEHLMRTDNLAQDLGAGQMDAGQVGQMGDAGQMSGLGQTQPQDGEQQQKPSQSTGHEDIDDILGAAAAGVNWDSYGDGAMDEMDFDFS